MKGIKKIWTQQEILDLKENFPRTWNKVLAKRYQCGYRTVIRKARELGLEKSPDFRDGIDFTSFSKGVKPWNKGKKGKVLSPGCEKTWFKQGNPSPIKNPETLRKAVNTRKETVRLDKLRRKYGLSPITKLNLKNLD